jgi:hypothetical protein
MLDLGQAHAVSHAAEWPSGRTSTSVVSGPGGPGPDDCDVMDWDHLTMVRGPRDPFAGTLALLAWGRQMADGREVSRGTALS